MSSVGTRIDSALRIAAGLFLSLSANAQVGPSRAPFGGAPDATLRGVSQRDAQAGACYDSFVMQSSIMTPDPFPLEKYLVGLPVPLPSEPQPLLVVFHSAAHTCQFPLVCHGIFEEATKRGWYVVCPTGGVKQHFASEPAQVKFELVLEHVLALLNGAGSPRIDTERIYAIGFSMGAGAGLNYAARHLDPREPMFAAAIHLSGAVSHRNTFEEHPPSGPALLFWYEDAQNSGMLDPFRAQRSSLLEYDPKTCIADPTTDMVRNLLHVALRLQRYGTESPSPHVSKQIDVLYEHLTMTLGHPRVTYEIVDGTGHDWDVIDPVEAMDYLEPFTLELPVSGDTLADRDARFFYFDVSQDLPDAFTPFSWAVDPETNTVSLFATENLAAVAVDTVGARLDLERLMFLEIGPSPDLGASDVLTLLDYPTPPSEVRRDGIVDLTWIHDPVEQTLTVIEVDPGAHVWEIDP